MKHWIFILLAVLVSACKSNETQKSDAGEEDAKAKELLQGIWLDDDTEMAFFRIQGDTIYYADSEYIPVYFKIIKDSLYLYGNELSVYHIDKQAEHIFWFHSLAGDIVKLHKSESDDDRYAFVDKPAQAIPIYTEVTEKDSVVMYNGIRYRAYVYINPSTMKVVNTTYSGEGMGVDKIYYDNVMHICVYQGKECLYASDITKQMFRGIIPEDFLRKSILSDMDFIKIDPKGYHYMATVCIPESLLCYMVELVISFDGKLSMETLKS